MKMVVNNNLVNAAIKKYEAQIEEALATLHIILLTQLVLENIQIYLLKLTSMLKC